MRRTIGEEGGKTGGIKMNREPIGGTRKAFCAVVLIAMSIAMLDLSNGIASGPANGNQGPLRTSSLAVREWIFIDGNSNFTLAHGVTGGSGTASDPYVVEGWSIDVSTSEGFYAAGISIVNTDKYFIVRDCYVHGGLGILLWHCSNGILSNITCGIDSGMLLDHANSIVVADSTFENNSGGISLWVSNSNTFSNNRGFDIWLGNSQGETFRNNAMVRGGIQIDAEGAQFWRHYVDASNTLNGKPIYYYTGQTGGTVPAGAGQVILAECSGMTVKNQNLSNIRLGYSSYNTLSDNNCLDRSDSTSWSSAGIILESSDNNVLINNSCSNSSWKGIALHSSNGNSLIRNNCSSDFNGIDLYYSNSNNLVENDCSLNNRVREALVTTYGCGIILTSSDYNVFDSNNCSDCGFGISLYSSNHDTLISNDCSESYVAGILLSACGKATLVNNTLDGNGISVNGDELSHWNTHMIDPSNAVDGRPVFYLRNQTGITVPSGVGQVILANCAQAVIRNLNLSDVACGIALGFCSGILISNNICSSNSVYGIYLKSSDNDSLDHNSCTSNDGFGILLESSNDNAVTDNDCSNNGNGISLGSSSSRNVLVGNDCSSNIWNGISLSSARCNTLSENTCSGCDYGISLDGSSNNIVSDNQCSDNNCGLFLFYSSNNTIMKNYCSSNDDNGMVLESSCNDILVTQNWFINNGLYGVMILSGSNNRIWNNTYIDNNGAGSAYRPDHAQANDEGAANSWNSTGGYGNYWSDWTMLDGNHDGIVDLPYEISGAAAAKDHFPLTTFPQSLPTTPPDAEKDIIVILPDLSLVRLAVAVNSIAVVLSGSLVVIVLWTRRNQRRSEAGMIRGDQQFDWPTGEPNQVNELKFVKANGAAQANGQSLDRRWPTRAASGPLRLTAKERILLHLLHFARYADSSEVPPELTQERIAEAAGIERRHFTQYVHPLEEDELVRERTSRVRGVIQKRRVYVLTEEGVRRSIGVRDRVRSATVRVQDASGVREISVAEALLEARGSMSVLDILRESIETGVVDLTRSVSSGREPAPGIVVDYSSGEEIGLMRR